MTTTKPTTRAAAAWVAVLFLVVLAATFHTGDGAAALRIATTSKYYETTKKQQTNNHTPPDAQRRGPSSTVRGKTNDKASADRAREQERRELHGPAGPLDYIVHWFHLVFDFFGGILQGDPAPTAAPV